MKTLRQLNLNQKKVLVRCDFNVPLSERGKILDDFRIKKTLPTINFLLKKKAKVILMSHLGKPGEIKNLNLKIKKCSLRPVAKRLEKLLNRRVKFLPDCIGIETEKEVEKMKPGDIVLLENLRFHKEEKEGDSVFARKLANLGEVFLNDAFGVSHRNHASVSGIPKFLPAFAGLLLEREIKILKESKDNPKKPLVAVIGGKKVEDKSRTINEISKKAEFILISGLIKREIKKKKIALKFPRKIIEPIDEIDGKDIGPKTIALFKKKIAKAKTIFWAGPLGKIEDKKFQKGTEEIALAIARARAFSIAGGGSTEEFINKIGLLNKFNHVSTGGGAMLAYLAGEKLPGLEALKG